MSQIKIQKEKINTYFKIEELIFLQAINQTVSQIHCISPTSTWC